MNPIHDANQRSPLLRRREGTGPEGCDWRMVEVERDDDQQPRGVATAHYEKAALQEDGLDVITTGSELNLAAETGLEGGLLPALDLGGPVGRERLAVREGRRGVLDEEA